MTTHDAPVAGVMCGRHRDWIPVTTLAVPTVWMATPDGLVLLDLVAVELAANGLRKGWTLTRDEARYTAGLLLERGVPYSVVASRVGASGTALKLWFPEQAVPAAPELARDGTRKSRPSSSIRCGTCSGYSRHHRRGETPCQPCKDAYAVADRYYRRHGTYVGAPEASP